MVDSYEFARFKKLILTASEADPPEITDVVLDDEFVRFEVPASDEWVEGEELLRERPASETHEVVVRPINRVVSWYERLVEELGLERHLHVDVLDLDGDRALEARCKHEWVREYLAGERTEASFVSLFGQTLGPAGHNEENDSSLSPWHDVDDVPPDLGPGDVE